MQSFHVWLLLVFIALTTLTEAQLYPLYDETRCKKLCGNVGIPLPFGIGRDCSWSEWYTVDCNSSTPYLSALNNVEVLAIDSRKVIVNISVIADCKTDTVQNTNIVLSTSHGRSPFLFSGPHNIFIVKGCGNAAIMEENGTIVSGCSTTCRNDTVSDLNNCFGVGCCQTTIPHDLKSFILNLTGLKRQGGEGTCGSAFLVDKNYVERFSTQSIDNTFVPISLSWNDTFNLNSAGCVDTCGDVSIPYPFGIGRNCSWAKWFTVDCNSSKPYLSTLNNAEVLGVNVDQDKVTVNVSLSSDCENRVQNDKLNLSTSPFRFSGFDNIFAFEGCGNAAIMDEYGTVVSGCSTTCLNDTITISDIYNCFGIGCCQTMFPHDLESFTLNLTGLKREAGNGSCVGSAFLVDRNSFIHGRFSRQFVPITLSYTRTSLFNSKECLSCISDGGLCYPNPLEVSGISCEFPGKSNNNSNSHNGVILGVSISMVLLFLIMASYTLYKMMKKTQIKRRKQRCFRRNGGLLLKQQEAANSGLVDKTILFTSDELEKATNQFNENRILGQGAQGTVYKGMLADGRIVAIKKSKVVDESQLQQFINEVVILSQVNHRNVVKLLGCCLETVVPLLVSEFISNGTLYELIQDETCEFLLSFNMRLQIATDVAGALSYLHSASSIPIYHRDVKTTNILLDEKYRAKVSDFGTSRFVQIDQTHLTTLVKGTFGYLDPEYFQSSQFTEKSDVYSFGVVLLELLTSEKPISLTRFGENRSLATHFMLAMEEFRVMSIFDAMVVQQGSRSELMAIANLAFRCLNLNGKNRPTMKEVASKLEDIRLSHVPSTSQTNFGHAMYPEEVLQAYTGSVSTSLTFDDDLCR